MNASYPLSQNELELINSVLESTPILASVLKKCQACGLPADELIAKVESQATLAKNLKAQFFPDQP